MKLRLFHNQRRVDGGFLPGKGDDQMSLREIFLKHCEGCSGFPGIIELIIREQKSRSRNMLGSTQKSKKSLIKSSV